MSVSPEISVELRELFAALRDNSINDAQADRLMELLRDDPAARKMYIHYVAMTVNLAVVLGSVKLNQDFKRDALAVGEGDNKAGTRSDASPLFPDALPPSVVPVFTTSANHQPQAANSFPVPGFFGNAYRGTANFFAQEIPFACLMATLFVIVGGIIGSLVTKEHYTQMPGQSVASSDRSYTAPESDGSGKACAAAAAKEQKDLLQFVGRITGMVDCRWADPGRTFGSSTDYLVALHDKYSLTSGLMEITYYSGAKVILQGPVTYQVESANGGYMSVGKLTAKVEVEKAKGFFVRTPTAVVTDLGTEFGVEVEKAGTTHSHVYRGKVELRTIGGGKNAQVVTLETNQFARVDSGGVRVVTATRGKKAEPVAYVREMPKQTPIKVFATGFGLKARDADPHWQIVARSDNPNFRAQSAFVVDVDLNPGNWRENDDRSCWLSMAGDLPFLPNDATYTFRTTFELPGLVGDKAILRGQFIADNQVKAIRLNGNPLQVPEHGFDSPFVVFQMFKATKGFVKGINVLEIDVYNDVGPRSGLYLNPMLLRVELWGEYAFLNERGEASVEKFSGNPNDSKPVTEKTRGATN